MKRYSINLVLVGAGLILSIASADSLELTTGEKQCAVTKAKATRKLFACTTRSVVKEIRKDLSEAEVDQLVAQCETKHTRRFERAESRALAKGKMCAAVDDASSVQQSMRDFCQVLLEPGGGASAPNVLCRHTPVTTAEPFAFIPTDRSCCNRPEDGVGLPDGAIVVGDQQTGLRYIAPDHSSSRAFGKLPTQDLLVNGVSRDKHGYLIVTDIGGSRVFEVDPETEDTRLLFANPVPVVLNDAVRSQDGRLWVSLSTSSDLLDAILEPIPDGAILRIDPTATLEAGRFAYDNAQAVVVADKLMFANGLLLDEDETHLFWAETTGNVIMKAPIGVGGELGTPVIFAQIPFGGDNLAMDERGNVYFANDWLTGVWAVDKAGIAFPIIDFRWSKTPLLIRGWANAHNTPEERLDLLIPNKRPPQFPRVPSTPFFVKDGTWLCLGTYETDLEPDHFNQLPCMRAPVRGQMK